MKKGVHKKRRILILSACCLIFIFAVVAVFSIFQHRLNENFHNILSSGLQTNVQDQKDHAQSVMADLQRLLELLADTPSAVSDDGWELVIQNGSVHVDYLDPQQAQSLCDALDESNRYFQQLQAGESVMTGLMPGEEASFMLLHPLSGDAGLTGVLRASVDTTLLIGGSMDSVSLFQKAYTVLASPEGRVLFADTPYPDGSNLFESVVQGGIDSDQVASLHQLFLENQAGKVHFYGKGNHYYMAWDTLEEQNCRIVRFARSPDAILQMRTILKGVILSGICLIALTAVFCVVLIQLLLRQKRRLETQKRRYNALSQFNDTLLFEYDVAANRVVFTPNALERLDLDAGCLEGISGEYYMGHLLHPDDRENIRKSVQLSQMGLGESLYLEARFRCRGGEYSWFGCRFKSIERTEAGTTLIVGKLVDISDQRGREQVLRQAALVDALTGVYNRSVEQLVNEQLGKNESGLFFMIDLDNFKTVNDAYGHAAGDGLLIHVAQILREVFRPDDIIGRVGGDEFAVFISGTNDPAVASGRAAAIQHRLEQLCTPGSGQPVSASIGAAIAPRDGTSYDALTRAADQAMYTIKKNAKKGFAVHQSTDRA